MIGWLSGVLREKHPPFLLLDVNGVGYELEAPMTTFYGLPETGRELSLYIHHAIREDAQNLYAFATADDRDVFRLLLRVNGVGAKLALALLSGMDAPGLVRCIVAGDVEALIRVPGVGKKTAQRLVMEMRDPFERLPASQQLGAPVAAGGAPPAVDPAREAVSALVALGIKPPDASRMVHAIDGDALSSEDIIRRALQSMGK
jgi:holliday junction DNA helicase RuvA